MSDQPEPNDEPQLPAAPKPPQVIKLPAAGIESLTQLVFDRISKVDIAAAQQRVNDLRVELPEADIEALVDALIRRKVAQTAAVGGATSASALVPGLGTLAAATLGVAADIGLTFTFQAELVIEIAEVHGRRLSDTERRQIVLLVTGISAGANQLISRAGVRASEKIAAAVAGRWVAKLVPFLGIAASAGINAVSTYLVGQRAHAYFSLGPEALHDWKANARALTGIDERKIAAALHDVREQATRRTSGALQQIRERLGKRTQK